MQDSGLVEIILMCTLTVSGRYPLLHPEFPQGAQVDGSCSGSWLDVCNPSLTDMEGDILHPHDACDNLGESPENHAEFKKKKRKNRRRKWQSTLVFLPGRYHGQKSREGCSPWGHMTEHTHMRGVEEEGLVAINRGRSKKKRLHSV